MNRFSKDHEKFIPPLPDASISYYPNFLELGQATRYFENFLENLHWEQYSIKIFGRSIPQPRLSALYGLNELPYTYSNLRLQAIGFPEELKEIQQMLYASTGVEFSHCLANLYRDGRDSMGWHSDNEKELGPNPVIASISLGAIRKFQLKHKEKKEAKFSLELDHGSLLVMEGTTQHHWKHQVPKTAKPISERINLTFRKILPAV